MSYVFSSMCYVYCILTTALATHLVGSCGINPDGTGHILKHCQKRPVLLHIAKQSCKGASCLASLIANAAFILLPLAVHHRDIFADKASMEDVTRTDTLNPRADKVHDPVIKQILNPSAQQIHAMLSKKMCLDSRLIITCQDCTKLEIRDLILGNPFCTQALKAL